MSVAVASRLCARWSATTTGGLLQNSGFAMGSAPRAWLHMTTRMQAGHSKWANIQHRKGRQDSIKMQNFCKLSRAITVAAKIGGGDQPSNHKLEMAVQKARAVNMPKDKIQAAIDKVLFFFFFFSLVLVWVVMDFVKPLQKGLWKAQG